MIRPALPRRAFSFLVLRGCDSPCPRHRVSAARGVCGNRYLSGTKLVTKPLIFRLNAESQGAETSFAGVIRAAPAPAASSRGYRRPGMFAVSKNTPMITGGAVVV